MDDVNTMYQTHFLTIKVTGNPQELMWAMEAHETPWKPVGVCRIDLA